MYDAFLQELIQINFLPVCVVMFLAVFLFFNHTYEADLTKRFTPLLIMLVCLIIDDNVDYYFFNGGVQSFSHVLTAFLGYNIRIALMLSLMLVASRNANVKLRSLIYIPAILNFLITSLAFFTKLVFWYGENGEIMRGPLAYTPHFTMMVYAIILYLYAIKDHREGKSQEAALIAITVTLCILGTFVEMAFALRGILIGVVAMDVTFYYLYIHIEWFKVDVLTGALNRMSFYADVERLRTKVVPTRIISVDMNGLKAINDTYGHSRGDEAIKYAADLIRASLPKGAKLYRIGGDEFVVLYPDDGRGHDLSADLLEKTKDAKYTFAIGEALWDGCSSFEKMYVEADRHMYECKKHQKADAGQDQGDKDQKEDR